MQLRNKKSSSNKPDTEREDKDNSSLHTKRVLIYIPSYTGQLDSSFVESLSYFLFKCFRYEKFGYKFFLNIGRRMMIHEARNNAVKYALDNEMDYILFIDDDMVIDSSYNLFDKLIKHDKDIVAPLFFKRFPPYMPLLFKRNIYADGRYTTFDNIVDYKKGLVKVDGVGFGCVLIKTSVFKDLDKPYFMISDTFGEDLYFCNKAINKGIDIFVDTTITVGHLGEKTVADESLFNQLKDIAKQELIDKQEKDIKKSNKYIYDVDIIMACYKDYKMTRDAIESVINNSVGVKFNLILVNDGMKDKQLTNYLRRLSEARNDTILIENKYNIGWIKVINQGFRFAKSKYVMMINNDIIVPDNMKDWLYKMCLFLNCNKKAGAVGPVSNYVMGLQDVRYNKTFLGLHTKANFLIGFCMLLKKEVIDDIGFLDERFGMGGNDDLDYSIRMIKAGYDLYILRDVFIQHIGTQSLPDLGDVAELENKTREILVDKWGKEEVDSLFKIKL